MSKGAGKVPVLVPLVGVTEADYRDPGDVLEERLCQEDPGTQPVATEPEELPKHFVRKKWPAKLNAACINCGRTFGHPPVPVVEREIAVKESEDGRGFIVHACVCSLPCYKTYVETERPDLLGIMGPFVSYFKGQPYPMRDVQGAPHRSKLRRFGGELTDAELVARIAQNEPRNLMKVGGATIQATHPPLVRTAVALAPLDSPHTPTRDLPGIEKYLSPGTFAPKAVDADAEFEAVMADKYMGEPDSEDVLLSAPPKGKNTAGVIPIQIAGPEEESDVGSVADSEEKSVEVVSEPEDAVSEAESESLDDLLDM
jgi:hypothetical protein